MTARVTALLPSRLRRVFVADPGDPASWRNQQMARSFATSIFSKGVSLVLQLVAIPLAIRALGADRYGVYAVLAGVLAWITMAGIGIGPGLTLHLAASGGDRGLERRLFVTAGALMALMSVLALVVLAAVMSLAGVRGVFGEALVPYTPEITEGLWVLGGLIAFNLVLSVAEAAQAGYQNQYITNLWTIAGNVLTIVLLLVVAFGWQTVTGMIVAVYGSITAARLANGVFLLWKRPYLLPSLRVLDGSLVRMLIGSGLAFLLGQVASYILQQYGTFWVGREIGPPAAATFAVMAQMMLLLGSFVAMFTVPLWPAIADARVQKDDRWIRKVYRRSAVGLMTYALLVGGGIALLGGPIVSRWIGPDVAPSLPFQVLSGLFFVLAIWDNLNYSVLLGFGRVWLAAIVFATGAGVVLMSSMFFVSRLGVTGMALSQCLGSVLVNSWLLPLLVLRELRHLHQRSAG